MDDLIRLPVHEWLVSTKSDALIGPAMMITSISASNQEPSE
jgi:hypothetical protein